jgi:hypothetical protein
MIGRMAVVDATVHALNMERSVSTVPMSNDSTGIPFSSEHSWEDIHLTHSAKRGGKYDEYIATRQQWERPWKAEEVYSALFEESWTDFGVFHGLGGMAEGRKLRELAPDRVWIYAMPVDPFNTARMIEDIDRWVEEDHIIGLKFYPFHFNGYAEQPTPKVFPLDDEKLAYPIIEHAQKRGIRSIAVHKAMGWVLKPFGVTDLVATAQAFPKMNFEIVHAGFAFLEDMAVLAGRSNIWLNLESTSAYLSHSPRRFAEVLGRFLTRGIGEPNAEDRIIWSTGCMAGHCQPLLELFKDFKMPADMVEGFGYRELTDEIKRKILGENFARLHGWDLDQMVRAIGDSKERRAQLAGHLAPPWSKVPVLA